VVEVPAALHAASCVCGAGDDAENRQYEPEGWTQVRRMREQDGAEQADEDNQVSPEQRRKARIEDSRRQGNSLVRRRGRWFCGLRWNGRKVADGCDRNFDGPEAVGRNVMDDDAQIRFAFDGSRDFEVIADGRLEKGSVVFGRKIELDDVADGVKKKTFG